MKKRRFRASRLDDPPDAERREATPSSQPESSRLKQFPGKPLRILLFGKNGQVGWELQRSLAPLGKIIALDSRDTAYCGDLANLEGIRHTVRDTRPDVIVNAAAYTAVDRAESEPERVHLINAQAPEVLARAARQVGALLVHYSSDHVFDGSREQPWQETDPTVPLNVYGQSKLAGEQAIVAAGDSHLILRTGWIHSARGANFVTTILRQARRQERVSAIDDQTGAPTGADLLADVTAHAIRSVMENPGRAGLYHVMASGSTSWHGFARFIVDHALKAGMPLKTAANRVEPVATGVFHALARRPPNSRLNTLKLQQTFGLALPDWNAGVTRLLDEIIAGESN
jgi:dTDP-4-dehydrorhamnose reductase